MSDDKKTTLFARYKTLLVEHPFKMQVFQASVLTAAGNGAQQLFSTGAIVIGPLVEQVIVTACCVSPIAACWIPILTSFNLPWYAAMAVSVSRAPSSSWLSAPVSVSVLL